MNDEKAQASDHLRRAVEVLRDELARHPEGVASADRRALALAAMEEALALLSDGMSAAKPAARVDRISALPSASQSASQSAGPSANAKPGAKPRAEQTASKVLAPNPSLRRAIAAVDVVVRTPGVNAGDGAAHVGRSEDPAQMRREATGSSSASVRLPVEHHDLTRIRGITRALADALNRAGVTTYGQIAAWTAADVKRVSGELGIGRDISRGVWIEQAALLAQRYPLPEPDAPIEDGVGGVPSDLDADPAGGSMPAPDGSERLAAASVRGLPITRIRRLNLAGFARSERRADVEVRQPGMAQASGDRPTSRLQTNSVSTGIAAAGAANTGWGSQSPLVDEFAGTSSPAHVGRWRAGELIDKTHDGTFTARGNHDREVRAVVGTVDAGDDLRLIAGVSGFAARTLRSLGVTRFSQIAAWTADDVRRHQRALGARARIVLDNWIEQAAMLAEGQPTRFEALYRHGVISAVVVRPREVRWPARLGRTAQTVRDNGAVETSVLSGTRHPDVVEAPAGHVAVQPDAPKQPDAPAHNVHAAEALNGEARVEGSDPRADATPSAVAALPALPPNRPAPSLEERISQLQAEIMQVRAFPASAPAPEAEVDWLPEFEPRVDDAADAQHDAATALSVAPDAGFGDETVAGGDDGPSRPNLGSDWFLQPAELRPAATPPPLPDVAVRLPEPTAQPQDHDAPEPAPAPPAAEVARLDIAIEGDFVTSADLTDWGPPDRAVPSAGSQPDNTHADVDIVYRTPGQDDSAMADDAVRPPPPDVRSDEAGNEKIVERLADRLRRLRAARRETGEETPAEPRRDYSIRPEEASVEIVERPVGDADVDVRALGHPGGDQPRDQRHSGATGENTVDDGSRRLRRVIDRHEAQGDARKTGLKRYLKALGGE